MQCIHDQYRSWLFFQLPRLSTLWCKAAGGTTQWRWCVLLNRWHVWHRGGCISVVAEWVFPVYAIWKGWQALCRETHYSMFHLVSVAAVLEYHPGNWFSLMKMNSNICCLSGTTVATPHHLKKIPSMGTWSPSANRVCCVQLAVCRTGDEFISLDMRLWSLPKVLFHQYGRSILNFTLMGPNNFNYCRAFFTLKKNFHFYWGKILLFIQSKNSWNDFRKTNFLKFCLLIPTPSPLCTILKFAVLEYCCVFRS